MGRNREKEQDIRPQLTPLRWKVPLQGPSEYHALRDGEAPRLVDEVGQPSVSAPEVIGEGMGRNLPPRGLCSYKSCYLTHSGRTGSSTAEL